MGVKLTLIIHTESFFYMFYNMFYIPTNDCNFVFPYEKSSKYSAQGICTAYLLLT